MAGAIRKSTAWDVAERAGVSQSTVSRVFTGSTRISDTTRNRVLDAAKALDYLPDKRASRLRSGRTGVLAVVVITRPEDSAREINPFVYALLGNVCRAASKIGHETLVSLQAEPGDFYGRYVEQRDADAMVVIGTTQNQAAWDHFRPLLGDEKNTICWGLPFDAAHSVRSDNRAAGRLAAEHLLAKGYRQPVFAGPIADEQRQFQERFEGFAEALGKLDIEPVVVRGYQSHDRIEQGREAVAWLEREKIAFDSIFAACDFIAMGALDALESTGQQVPQDVGLIGFDGIAAAEHTATPITTIKPDLEQAGQQLVAAVLGDAANDPDSGLAAVELVSRESTARR